MYTVVKKWLKEKVDFVLEDKLSVGSALRDGRVIAQVLQTYGVAAWYAPNLLATKWIDHYVNIAILKKWFQIIGLEVGDFELIRIAEGNNHAALKFLSRLYVCLEHYAKREERTQENGQDNDYDSECVRAPTSKHESTKGLERRVREIARNYCLCRKRIIAHCQPQIGSCDETTEEILKAMHAFEELHPELDHKVKEAIETEGMRLAKRRRKNFLEHLVWGSKAEKRADEASKFIEYQELLVYRKRQEKFQSIDIKPSGPEFIESFAKEYKKLKAPKKDDGVDEKCFAHIKLNLDSPNSFYDDFDSQAWSFNFNSDSDSAQNELPEKVQTPQQSLYASVSQDSYAMIAAKIHHLRYYLSFQKDWSIDGKDIPKQYNLGFIVTKLIQCSKRRPLPYQQPPLPHYEAVFALHGLPHHYHSVFKSMLRGKNILFVTVQDVIEYCVSEYRKRFPLPIVESSFSVHEDAVSDVSLSIQLQQLVLVIPDEAHYSTTGYRDVATQTPDVLPEPLPADEAAANVGKMITEKMAQSKRVLSDLIIKALICYLNKSKEWIGLVLNDFPANFGDLEELESNFRTEIQNLRNDSDYMFDNAEMSEIVPFIYNHKSKAPLKPYVSYFISIKPETIDRYDEINDVLEFYRQHARLEEVKCGTIGFDDKAIATIFQFISQNMLPESKPGLEELGSDPATIKYSAHKLARGRKKTVTFAESVQDEDASSSVISIHIKSWKVIPSAEFLTDEFPDFYAAPRYFYDLGIMWQSIENIYLENLTKQFVLRTKHNTERLHFEVYVETYFKNALPTHSKKKQALVDEFLRTYNMVSPKERKHAPMKTTLHKSVFDLQKKLLELCDKKNKKRKMIAKKFTKNDKFIDFVDNYFQVYLSLMNIELRRFSETMEFICAYYCLSYKKTTPCHEIIELKEQHVKIDKKYAKYFLKYKTPKGYTVRLQFLVKRSNRIFERYRRQIDAFNIKVRHPTRMRKDLFEQMRVVIADEKCRICIRSELIKQHLQNSINKFEQWFEKNINEHLDTMLDWYEKEIEAVNSLCSLLNLAIEEETKVVGKLLLKDNRFLLDSDINLIPTCRTIDGRTMQCSFHTIRNTELSSCNIKKLSKIFQKTAPRGVFQRDAILLILEDLKKETTYRGGLPKSWSYLTRENMESLVKIVYGNSKLCDWRDFLINSLEISFPELHELFDIATEFSKLDKQNDGLISWKDFQSVIEIWLQYPPMDPQEKRRFKICVFTMFRLNCGRISYPQVLLHLCKNFDILFGFRTALCMTEMLGLHTGWNPKLKQNLKPFPPSVSYKAFHHVIKNCSPNNIFPKIIMNKLKETWTWPMTMSDLIVHIPDAPELMKFLRSTTRFKRFMPSHIVRNFLFYEYDADNVGY